MKIFTSALALILAAAYAVQLHLGATWANLALPIVALGGAVAIGVTIGWKTLK